MVRLATCVPVGIAVIGGDANNDEVPDAADTVELGDHTAERETFDAIHFNVAYIFALEAKRQMFCKPL